MMHRSLRQLTVVLTVIVAGASASSHGAVIYTTDNAPETPRLAELPLKQSISQYGITWTFQKPIPVGQFVNGDWYVVGPVTVTAIEPKPENGRNGSCLNVTARVEKIGFDSRIIEGRYDPNLFLAPPIALKPGDSLLSSVSLEEIRTVKPMLWRIGQDMRTPVRTVAALTCLKAPVTPDAFRPAYCGKEHRIYLARNLKRELLPMLPHQGVPFTCHQGRNDEAFGIGDAARWCQRPWIDIVMDEFGAPVENMPTYGAQVSRAVGLASLLLCLDFPPEEKEELLINFVQIGIDFWGLAREGQPARWVALGGHGSGRKWPIIFAGLLLGDEKMSSPTKEYPELLFGEDMQTMFGKCWTGAKVLYAGQLGAKGHPRRKGWGLYEHLPPKEWEEFNAESWRRCCTSNAWVGQALAARILHVEELWNHDAFFAYVDRWMKEDDTKHIEEIKQAKGWDYSAEWARQGSAWDPFVKELWRRYRNNLPPAPDGHKDPPAEETWK
jgi:hypothetical protein